MASGANVSELIIEKLLHVLSAVEVFHWARGTQLKDFMAVMINKINLHEKLVQSWNRKMLQQHTPQRDKWSQ